MVLDYGKNDVYALGMTLWSTMSTISLEIAFDHTTKRRIAELPSYYGDSLKSLVYSMLEIDSKKRPDFLQIQTQCLEIIAKVIMLSL
jgi:hypothetical protein